MRRHIAAIVALAWCGAAFGQAPSAGDKHIMIRSADGTSIRSGANCYAVGANVVCDQVMQSAPSSASFAIVHSGVTDAGAWSAAIDTAGLSILYIKVEAGAATDQVTLDFWFYDEATYVPVSSTIVATSIQHDAANAPSLGTGLVCTTACWGAPMHRLPTYGMTSLKIKATASTGDTVSVWVAKIVGSDGYATAN